MKKSLILFVTLSSIFMFTGCQSTPDMESKDGIVTAKSEPISVETSTGDHVINDVPDSLIQTFSEKDCVLEIDADVYVPKIDIIKGTVKESPEPSDSVLSKVLFDNSVITKTTTGGIGQWAIEGEDESKAKVFNIQPDSTGNLYRFDDRSISALFSIEDKLIPYAECTDTQKKMVDELVERAQSYIDDLGFHHIIDNSFYYNGKNEYAYFNTVNVLNGVKVCTSNVVGGKPDINSSGYMEISDAGLNSITICSDFTLDTQESCSLITWDSLVGVLEGLTEQQSLRRLEDAKPISHIELKYLIVQENNTYTFHPVWSFEAYVDGLSTIVPVFAIDATNGNLDFFNGYY